MTVKTKPRMVGYYIKLWLAMLFLFLSCKQPTDEQASYPQTAEMDSISTWIVAGRDASKTFVTRQANLQKAYESTLRQSSDTIKLKYLSKIQWSFSGLKDSLWFRKTNRETNQLAFKLGDSTRMAGSSWDLGLFLNDRAVKDSAFYHLSKAQKIYDQLGDDKRNGSVLYDIARFQADIKDYAGSEINLIRAIELLEPLEDHFWMYRCYNLLGTVTKDLGDYERAAIYYDRATEYLKKAGATRRLKNTLENNIGVNYHEMGKFEKAISHFETAISEDSLRLKSPSKYARTLNNLAKSKYMLDHENVEKLFLESIKIRDSIEDQASLAGGYFNLAEYYTYKKDTLKAIACAKKSQTFARESSNNSRLLESLGLLTKIDHLNASVHGQNYANLSDSLLQEERRIRNKFARIRFETDEVVAQNELLTRQRQLWTGIAVALILLGMASFIIINQRVKNRILQFRQQQQANNQEIFNLMLAQGEKVEEGKKMEQKRVSEELHDGVLGKMLGARMMLLGLNKKTDPDAIEERAKAISILQDVEGEVRSISHELSHAAYQKIHNFILSIKELVQTIENASKINIDFKFTDELDWDALSGEIKINLYRMVQESLQNSVKHASCKNIYMDFHANESLLTVDIADDGKGFVQKRGKKGIGMRNMASRIKKINGNWDIKSEVGSGTKVSFIIPLVSNDNENAPSISPRKPNLQEI